MNLRLERLIWRRSGRVCEYCRMPQEYDDLPFQIDHIIFHPRRHQWQQHFLWDGPRLAGLTAIGRATIAVLEINLPHRIALRQALIEEGLFPPVVTEKLSGRDDMSARKGISRSFKR